VGSIIVAANVKAMINPYNAAFRHLIMYYIYKFLLILKCY